MLWSDAYQTRRRWGLRRKRKRRKKKIKKKKDESRTLTKINIECYFGVVVLPWCLDFDGKRIRTACTTPQEGTGGGGRVEGANLDKHLVLPWCCGVAVVLGY